MKILKLSIATCSLLFSSLLIAQNPNPDSDIDSQIADEMQAFGLVGVSTAVVKGGKVIWMNSYGKANTVTQTTYTDTTSQLLASVSKVFAGVALMQLHEKGHFQLDDSINAFLPFKVRVPGFESDAITFRMLLTHTGSLQDSDAGDTYYNWKGDPTISLSDVCQRFFATTGSDYDATDNFIDYKPGTKFNYCNMATALEGYLVELIAQKPFHQYCNENIFDPLCMYRTRWNLSEFSDTSTVASPHDSVGVAIVPKSHYGFADFPSGGLKSNVSDLSNFMIAVLNGGTLNGTEMLKKATLDSMMKVSNPAVNATMGLQFYQEEYTINSVKKHLWGHGGSEVGTITEMYFDASNDIGVVVLTNSRNSVTNIVEILMEYGLELPVSSGREVTCGLGTGVNNLENKNLSMAPNPTDGLLSITGLSGVESYSISNITGSIVMHGTTAGQVDLSDLKCGIYFVKVLNQVEKVIKQ